MLKHQKVTPTKLTLLKVFLENSHNRLALILKLMKQTHNESRKTPPQVASIHQEEEPPCFKICLCSWFFRLWTNVRTRFP